VADPERPRLDSWKEVAQYLDRDVRTVVRWEKERGLPVHRVPGGRSRTIFAYPDELDQWLARGSADIPGPDQAALKPRARYAWWRPVPVVTVLAVAAISIGLVTWVRGMQPIDVHRLAYRDGGLTALSSRGDALWSFTPPLVISQPSPGQRWYDVGELDNDPGPEVVAGAMGPWESVDALYALSNRGGELWTRTLDDILTIGGVSYGPPWRSSAVDVFAVDGQPRIAWTTHHHTWDPSILAVFDARGERLDRFIHPGWLTAVQASADGRYVLAAGVVNAQNAYVLAVLDARHARATAPSRDGPGLECPECPRERPLRYYILSRSELATHTGQPLVHDAMPVQIAVLSSGRVEVRARETPGLTFGAEAIYEFNADLTFNQARVSDSYWTWHEELERAGRVDHPASACPDRRGLRVQQWLPESGWRDLTAGRPPT
jgi:hypothetical protein